MYSVNKSGSLVYCISTYVRFTDSKFEMTLELLTQQEAEERPAGKRRDGPSLKNT